MTPTIYLLPQQPIVYFVYRNKDVVQIGCGKSFKRSITTLLEKGLGTKLVAIDDKGIRSGEYSLRYVLVDDALKSEYAVPRELCAEGQYPTNYRTNLESVLMALHVWQHGSLPHFNEVEGGSANKGGWLADTTTCLTKIFALYECFADKRIPWPKIPELTENTGSKFLAAWVDTKKDPPILTFGHCSVSGSRTPVFTQNPILLHQVTRPMT